VGDQVVEKADEKIWPSRHVVPRNGRDGMSKIGEPRGQARPTRKKRVAAVRFRLRRSPEPEEVRFPCEKRSSLSTWNLEVPAQFGPKPAEKPRLGRESGDHSSELVSKRGDRISFPASLRHPH
jgi:hypothetical protein